MKEERLGEIHTTKEGYIIKIVEYINKRNCTIEFENNIRIYNKQYTEIRLGTIKNPYHPRIYDIGYIGIGKYLSTLNKIVTIGYKKWYSMFERIYSTSKQLYQPTYKGCTVDERWHNFQNFAEWFEQNYNPEYMKGWQLDKDILIKGNKIYSPETCCFVPAEINHVLTKSDKARGKYPIGVIKKGNKFQAKYKIYLGVFETIEEAFQAYKIAKEMHITDLANKWKSQITTKVYQALINYPIEITD